MKVSIIVPTLNEELGIEKTLTEIQQLSPHELIVSDGGSTDHTESLATNFCDHLIKGIAGRARQMNAGARQATGDILLFLHADNQLKPKSFKKMLEHMENPNWVGGAFTLCIESERLSLRMVTFLANLRSRYFGLAYGDQGFFVRREIFHKMDGFSLIPICEDLDFYQRLKKEGPVTLLREKTHTSPRRWIQEGIFFTASRNILISILFQLGFPNRILTKWYLEVR